MTKQEGHRWFSAFYTWLSRQAEKTVMPRIRPKLQGCATGKVVEIGIGPGNGLSYYSPAVELTAVEPDPFMLERARQKALEESRQVEFHQAHVEALPLSDASFDSAVVSLVLCSVGDQKQALAEIKRVLRPGGSVYFFEHVRYGNPVGALFQDLVAPLWSWMGAGCHPNRNTGKAIKEAGFSEVDYASETTVPMIPPLCLVRPHILGWARK